MNPSGAHMEFELTFFSATPPFQPESLLKGSKRAETETISKQYKRWQIYLTNKIRELYAPMGVNFKLLECSNLVGLFSCVFVRDQEWVNVRTDWTHVDMVKTGLKGYHGNKVSKANIGTEFYTFIFAYINHHHFLHVKL